MKILWAVLGVALSIFLVFGIWPFLISFILALGICIRYGRGTDVAYFISGTVATICISFVLYSFASSQNGMVVRDQAMKEAWSNVDTDLQRRADLIPNLVATVKGFTKEESGVYGEVAQARDDYMNAQTPEAKMAASNQMDGALAKLLVITENYPELRSSEQFLNLQDELAGTENRIKVSRMRYNDALRDYNTYILQFPNSIWARILGFHQNNAYFQSNPAAQAVPQVNF